MVVLRCTRALLARLGRGRPPAGGAATPSTAAGGPAVLGDWYATAFVVARRPLVLAAAERSLCAVVLPLAPARTLVPRWREAVGRKLADLGVAPAQVDGELAAMAGADVGPVSYREPAGRRMVGVLTDMVYQCEPWVVRVHARPGVVAAGLSLPPVVPDLAGMEAALDRLPCAPLRYANPVDATRALFAGVAAGAAAGAGAESLAG